MKTNHQRGFKANNDAPRPDNKWGSRNSRKLQSGKMAYAPYQGCLAYDGNRGKSRKIHSRKKSLNQADRRDGKVVIEQQLGELQTDEFN